LVCATEERKYKGKSGLHDVMGIRDSIGFQVTLPLGSSNVEHAKERENIASVSAGVAALGAVVALAVSTAAASPLIGGAIGALCGAGIGYFIDRYSQKRLSQDGTPRSPNPMASSEVKAVIAKLAYAQEEKSRWGPIRELMELLDSSSTDARKELAKELDYPGPLDGSAEMNAWLREQLMLKLAGAARP
jgi:Domain of unknown function (DUF3597)